MTLDEIGDFAATVTADALAIAAQASTDTLRGLLWVAEDGDGEPCVWRGPVDHPRPVVRRCDLADVTAWPLLVAVIGG